MAEAIPPRDVSWQAVLGGLIAGNPCSNYLNSPSSAILTPTRMGC